MKMFRFKPFAAVVEMFVFELLRAVKPFVFKMSAFTGSCRLSFRSLRSRRHECFQRKADLAFVVDGDDFYGDLFLYFEEVMYVFDEYIGNLRNMN